MVLTYSDDSDVIEVAVDLDTPTVIDMEEGKGRVSTNRGVNYIVATVRIFKMGS